MIPFCLDQQLAIMPWSPLARGFLVGNRSRSDWGTTVRAKTAPSAKEPYYREDDFAVVDAVVSLARTRNVSAAQLALAWLLHKPGVTSPIIGATRIDQLEELVGALDIRLSPEEIQQLEAPYRPHPVLGHS
jgi:aryl-alcohol dehydrogenase (NADP+)